MKIEDWGYAAFMATLFGAMTSVVIALWIGIPYEWQPVVFTFMPIIFCGMVVFLPRIWRRMRGRTKDDAGSESMPPIEQHIDDIWGPSLEKMVETIDLADQRIQDAQERLQMDVNGSKTPLYMVIELGYKSVRLARAIRCLCANGFADEAYALCRNLMELEANIWFIMTRDDPAETCKRYNAWDNAKFYRYVLNNKSKLNPPEDKWNKMTEEYEQCVAEYGENKLGNPRGWAVARSKTRAKNRRRNRRRRNPGEYSVLDVPKRAWHAMRHLKSNRKLIYEVWKSRWDHLNSMVHNSPRSIMTSQASPKEGVIATGQSAYGLRDPIYEATRMALDISSTIAYYIPAEKTEKSKELGKQTMNAAMKTNEILSKVPAAANPWWQRKSESSK